MQIFRPSRQKCFLRVPMNIWWKFSFPLEIVTVFSLLLVSKQKIVSDFRWKRSERLSDPHFTCPEDQFEKEYKTLERNWLFLSFLALERKLIWLSVTFYLQCWENCVFRRHSSFLIFCESLTLFSSIPRFQNENSKILAEIFRHSCQNCI